MNIQETNKILKRCNILHLLEYAESKPVKQEDEWRIICPFHEPYSDHLLKINPETKQLECTWCGWKGDILDFLSKKFSFKNGDAHEYIERYWKENKPREKYNIVEQSNHKTEIEINGLYFTLTGLNLKVLHDFSMTVKIEFQNLPPFFNKVNLSRKRTREELVSEIQEHFQLSEEVISSTINILMEAVEKLQEDNIKRIEEEKEGVKKEFKPSSSEQDQAEKALQGDILNNDLLTDLERYGYVGDEGVKKFLYLAKISHMLENPISVLAVAQTSAGKSFAEETILKFVPDELLLHRTRLTDKAISHFGKHELVHKILLVDEYLGMKSENMSQTRSMLSKGRISTSFPTVDKLTGQIRTIVKDVFGPVAIFTSTTNEDIVDEESRNRYFILPIDESREQMLRIMRQMVRNKTPEGVRRAKERGMIERKHKAIHKSLRPVVPVFPPEWEDQLTFNCQKLSLKRSFNHYLSMIETLALLRQYTKKSFPVKCGDGTMLECIWVELRDVLDVNKIILELFGPFFSELSVTDQKCLDGIIKFCKTEAKKSKMEYYEIPFSRADLRWYLGWERRPIRTSFENLIEMEYIYRVYGSGKGSHYYKLNIDKGTDPLSSIKLKLWDGKIRKEK